MTTFATGVAKRITIAEETTFNTAVLTGSKYLRRVSSDLTLNKDSYESQEILPSQQLRDARHGVRRPQGTFQGQVSPGSFTDIWQGLLRNTFTTGSVLATVSPVLDIVAGTLTLGAGGYLAAGFRQEDVIRISGAASPNTALNGVNLRITGLSDTVITTLDLPTGLTSATLTGVTLSVVGKKLMIPAINQLYKSYTLEHWFSDVGISEMFTGVRFGQTSIAMPATGLVTFSSQMLGVNMVTNTSEQQTTPTGPTSSSSLAAVNGKLTYNSVDAAVVTGLNMTISPSLEAPAVVGSNTVPWIFMGNLRVAGTFTALFTDETIANTFLNEQTCNLSVLLTMGNAANADFMRFTLPTVKAMSNQKSDGQMSLVQSMSFTALENSTIATDDYTTIVIQDSLA